jgi:hypothetical protein
MLEVFGLPTEHFHHPFPLPGIKGEARRAAPDRPLGRALLQRLAQNFGGRG